MVQGIADLRVTKLTLAAALTCGVFLLGAPSAHADDNDPNQPDSQQVPLVDPSAIVDTAVSGGDVVASALPPALPLSPSDAIALAPVAPIVDIAGVGLPLAPIDAIPVVNLPTAPIAGIPGYDVLPGTPIGNLPNRLPFPDYPIGLPTSGLPVPGLGNVDTLLPGFTAQMFPGFLNAYQLPIP